MSRIRIKWLVEDLDRHGNVRLYVRRPGQPKVRIRAPLGTPEFWSAYQAAVQGAPLAPPASHPVKRAVDGTLRWLCEQYYKSAEFKRLDPRTQYVRRSILDRICTNHGDKPYRMMESRHVRKLIDEHRDRPGAANGFLKALRRLFSWAMQTELAVRNPARDVAYIRTASEGFHTWTEAEIHQFEARHPIGTKARLALALLLYTGVRRSDVVTLGRQMVNGATFEFVEHKGRAHMIKRHSIPILPELQVVIDATPSAHLTFLVTEYGKPFSTAGFGNWFRDRCNEAGLPQCSAHGLRKGGATIAAENGASEHQLMAIYGWESPRQAAIYTKKADRRRLARDAMHLIALRQSVPPCEPVTN